MSDKQWVPTATRFLPNCPNVDETEVSRPENDPVWPGMEAKVFIHIGRYIRNLANWLGLRDWQLNLSWEPLPDDDEVVASVNVTYGQRHATIRLQQSFASLPLTDQTRTLVHELFHLHFDPIKKLVQHTLRDALGSVSYGIFDGALTERIELITDAISVEIADMIPGIGDDWHERGGKDFENKGDTVDAG